MEIVTETETETESALGVMQGDIWSRCLTDAASKRRGGQSLLYLEYGLMSICKVPKLSLIGYDA